MISAERAFLLADIASVKQLLAARPAGDVIGRLSLEGRLKTLQQELASLPPEHKARVLLLFDGKPVREAGAIEARFSSKVLESYQDLIAKLHAQENIGRLAGAGPIPGVEASRLYLTGLVAGSCGLQLEEVHDSAQPPPQPGPMDSPLKRVVERATNLVIAAGEGDELFAEQVVDTNGRVLDSLKEFFSIVDDAEATFQIESSHQCAKFDRERVAQARGRVQHTTIVEEATRVGGRLTGLLTEGNRFEFRTEEGVILTGRLALEPWPDDLNTYLTQWAGKSALAVLRVERAETGARVKTTYRLQRLEKP